MIRQNAKKFPKHECSSCNQNFLVACLIFIASECTYMKKSPFFLVYYSFDDLVTFWIKAITEFKLYHRTFATVF